MFRTARTHRSWKSDPVPETLLRQIYDTARFGPTSANISPMRTLFVLDLIAKQRLVQHMSEGNREKTLSAPAVAIFCYDSRFVQKLDILSPDRDIKPWFDDPQVAERAARLNATLQAAYFLLAARAFGLDCGPMTGFSAADVDSEFFAESGWKSLIVCNLGYGDWKAMPPRSPRLQFEDACRLI